MEMERLTWKRIESMCKALARKVNKSGYKPEIIIGISRGGWIPARILSDMLCVYQVASIGVCFYKGVGLTNEKPKLTQDLNVDIKGKRVLLVDDVADTGESLVLARQKVLELSPSEVRVATLHYKPHSKFLPEFYAEKSTSWLVYPWERGEFKKDKKS
jgi:uncharacterized protein